MQRWHTNGAQSLFSSALHQTTIVSLPVDHFDVEEHFFVAPGLMPTSDSTAKLPTISPPPGLAPPATTTPTPTKNVVAANGAAGVVKDDSDVSTADSSGEEVDASVGQQRPEPFSGSTPPMPGSDLADVDVEPPVLGSPQCPSIGSKGHSSGTCKPCPFDLDGKCDSGVQCSFCHLCQPGLEQLHLSGSCRPCIFYHKVEGCSSGRSCNFCHFEHDARISRRRHLRRGRRQECLNGAAAVVPAL